MTQSELFYDSIYDAISNAIASSGGFKVVAGELWHGKKQETAYARLKACVDESKEEKLCAEEIMLIARMAKANGNHAIMRYLGDELGYRVEPLEPEDERTAIQRDFVAAVGKLEQIQKRADRLDQRLKAVK